MPPPSPALPAAAALLLLAAAAPAAHAAETRTLRVYCDDREALLDEAREEYGEERVWWGVVGEGGWVAELYRAPDTGSWTLVRVDPSGTACVLAGGSSSASVPGGDRP